MRKIGLCLLELSLVAGYRAFTQVALLAECENDNRFAHTVKLGIGPSDCFRRLRHNTGLGWLGD